MNLMDLFIRIGVDDQASARVGSISNKLGNGLKTAAKVGTAAVGAASAAIVKLAKDSISAYAEYEQLEGGVKKLFGEQDMKAVIANADRAYKTAGMSANKYLETTTSFAASLIAGLDGDTAKAAEYADMAIRDMSDNANTFGTDISMIQNAYQGFAKQNYTMLDNLKLGYGGTASEMARLINDSGVLGDTVTVTASNINRVSFDKIIEAINVTQERMGIMGTTMTEAEETIKGSVEAVKASWDNLMIAMINDPDSVGEKFDILAENIETAWENLKPSISAFSESIEDLYEEKFPVLSKATDVLIPTLLGLFAGFKSLEIIPKVSSWFSTLKSVLSGGVALSSGGIIAVAIGVITAAATAFARAMSDEETRKEWTDFWGGLAKDISKTTSFVSQLNDNLLMTEERMQSLKEKMESLSTEEVEKLDTGFANVLKAYGMLPETIENTSDDFWKELYEKLGLEYTESNDEQDKPAENVVWEPPSLSEGSETTINHFYREETLGEEIEKNKTSGNRTNLEKYFGSGVPTKKEEEFSEHLGPEKPPEETIFEKIERSIAKASEFQLTINAIEAALKKAGLYDDISRPLTEDETKKIVSGFEEILQEYGVSESQTQVEDMQTLIDKVFGRIESSVLQAPKLPEITVFDPYFRTGMSEDEKFHEEKESPLMNTTTKIDISINGLLYKDADELGDALMDRLMHQIYGTEAASD